jgi:hypothetical protein
MTLVQFDAVNWKFPTTLLIAVFLLLPVMAQADDVKAIEIMQKVKDRDDGDNRIATMEMILIDKRGNERIRTLRTNIKDKGNDSLKLAFFMSPPDVRDVAFLNYDYDNDYYEPDRDDDQWLYLPALKKSKRIASVDKSESFMGSDFSYSDMTTLDLEDYDFKLLGTQTVRDKQTWLIEALPKDNKVVQETGYTKSLFLVQQDNYVIIRAIYFVKEGSKVKYMDVKKLELIDNIWTETEIHMTTKKGEITLHKTILKYYDIKYNQELDEAFFTVQRMERGL